MKLEEAYKIAESEIEIGNNCEKIGIDYGAPIDLKRGTGGMRQVEAKNIPTTYRKTINSILKYLKAKGKYDKIAKKYDLKTPDIKFIRSGEEAIINYDDGGKLELSSKELKDICDKY